jgi:hypothetical protein
MLALGRDCSRSCLETFPPSHAPILHSSFFTAGLTINLLWQERRKSAWQTSGAGNAKYRVRKLQGGSARWTSQDFCLLPFTCAARWQQSRFAAPRQALAISRNSTTTSNVIVETNDLLPHPDRPNFISGQLLSKVSTWGIGGPAKYFIEVHDASQMAHVLRYYSQGWSMPSTLQDSDLLWQEGCNV